MRGLLRRPRKLPPHEKGMGGAFIPGRGFMTWDEIHHASIALNDAFDALPERQRKHYAETGRLD